MARLAPEHTSSWRSAPTPRRSDRSAEGVDVRAYIPMSTLLPAADVVAYHGGSGTMLAALAAGIPMLIVPLAADQPDNGDRCEAAGVARILEPDDVTASTARAVIEAILADAAYRSRAHRLAAGYHGHGPGPDAAVERIESAAARPST